jgi:hypothetical protein
MANPAQRPAGTEAEDYRNNEGRKRRLRCERVADDSVVRVHDVAEMVDVVKVANVVRKDCG